MAAPRSSRRRRFDDADWDADVPTPIRTAIPDHVPVARPTHTTYPDATRGPRPVPDWVVTDPRALDVDHGVLKTGKEADVSLVERAVPAHLAADGARRSWLAVKRYRSAEHRMFHRDAGYLEGRRVRKSREMRAMATRTEFGRELIAGQWASAEFAVLGRLWALGAAVPYPVQLIGTELTMEFIGSPDGTAAPRLAQLRPGTRDARDLYAQMVTVLRRLTEAGFAHGDLSAYNVLVDDGRLVMIDVPQAIDVVGNPQGFAYLRRDCENIAGWFAAHGVAHADGSELFDDLRRRVPGLGS